MQRLFCFFFLFAPLIRRETDAAEGPDLVQHPQLGHGVVLDPEELPVRAPSNPLGPAPGLIDHIVGTGRYRQRLRRLPPQQRVSFWGWETVSMSREPFSPWISLGVWPSQILE